MTTPSLGEGKGVGLHRNLSRPIATVEVTVIDHAELTGSNALHPTVGMHPVTAVTKVLSNTNKIVGCMPHLESNLLRKGGRYLGQSMKILDHELLLMCLDGLIAFHNIQDVVFHVFLHHIPRTAAQSKSFALADGVEPMSLVLT